MTLMKRLCVGVMSLATALAATVAFAQPAPRPLSAQDAAAYTSAFAAVDQGDFVGAEIAASSIQDRPLLGYVSFRQLMHPKAKRASFEELCSWLTRFKDLPLAEKVFSLASKRKPANADDPPAPEVAGLNSARSELTRPAREAFYSGDVQRAHDLAIQVGERWIAGLSSWRLHDFVAAKDYFSQLAKDDTTDPWLRAAGAFWAARSAEVLGDTGSARILLKLAATRPQTFYGMLAERKMVAAANQPEDKIGELIFASYQAPEPELTRFTAGNIRAHRAAALAQIGRYDEARQELRAGMALARTAEERQAWKVLVDAMGPAAQGYPGGSHYQVLGDYQTPPLEPRSGFTIDKALVYAIVRQESGFDPRAVSPVGAMGLMQVMPASAALAEGDEKLKRHTRVLLDPAMNLRIGQDYLAYLIDRGVGPDLLRVIAAYNAGPGAVLKTEAMVGGDDPLLLIECLPALETRNYVEKVAQAYWTYKRIFGEEPHTLDAAALGARRVDMRLDLPAPPSPQPQLTSQPVEISAVDDSMALD
jgi:soluble lytic murein transglycosylase-like protein